MKKFKMINIHLSSPVLNHRETWKIFKDIKVNIESKIANAMVDSKIPIRLKSHLKIEFVFLVACTLTK